LGAGIQTLSVTFTPTDAINYATATKTVNLVVNQAAPVITWAPPASIMYGTLLSGTELNATSGGVAGTFAYTPANGAVPATGIQTLSVTFTPSDTNYTAATKSVSLVINQATPLVTWAAPAAITYGTVLSATELNATASVPGTFAYTPASGTLTAGTQTLSVTFTPADATNFTTATKTMNLVVKPATPVITWATPADITYGTALSATQLNATSGGVAGTFVYTPASGTSMNTGVGQVLSVTFTPTDTANFNTPATSTVTITVAKATPVITSWPIASTITYGQTLVTSTLSGGASTPTGTFAFTTPATAPPGGTALQSVTFTPTDLTNYTSTTSTVNVTVNKASPVITWAPPSAITFGTALSATQLNATASVAGTFVYTPASGTILATGTQTLSVTFTPNDTTNYTTATQTVTLLVNLVPVNQITTGPDGKTTAPITTNASGALLSLPAGTQLLDANGNPISGTLTLTASVMNSTAALPTGLAGAPTSDGLVLTALGNAIDITISTGSSYVKTITPPMTVTLAIPSTYAAPGSTVSYYSYNGTTWISEGSTVVKADGTADMQTGHLSVWALATFASPLDSIAPQMNTFNAPATSPTLSVSGITLTASDAVGVTGYMITESATAPLATDSGWSTAPPTTLTLHSWGYHKLYAYAKDAVGNISVPLSASVVIAASDVTDGVIIPAPTGAPPKTEPQLSDALKSLNFAMKIEIPTPVEILHGDVAPLINGVPHPDGVINLGDTIVILRRVVGL
jgi:hypothetical protein